MTTVAAIALVVGAVQFLKKLAPDFVQGTVAQVLVIIASVGVTLYKYLSEGLPLTIAAIAFLVAVYAGAIASYSLIKVAGGSTEAGGSAQER